MRLDEILWVKAEDTYSKIVTRESALLVNSLLGDLINKLPEQEFVRVHRSFIVAINHIDKVYGDGLIISGTEIPISKSYKKSLMARIS